MKSKDSQAGEIAIDKPNIIESTRIILLNGFLKKSNKDYRKQIEIAQSILNDLEQ